MTRRRAPERPATVAIAAAPAASAPGALGACTLVLALVLIARLALGFVAGPEVWGLGGLQHAGTPVTWALAALALLACVPVLARVLAPAEGALGDALASGTPAPLLLALVSAALVALLPDRSVFVGDMMLRLGFVRVGVEESQAMPQTMPLDPLLHVALAGLWKSALHRDPFEFERVLGALRAAAFAGAAVLLARVSGARGAAALACVGVALATGALALCTGYGKALADLALVALLATAFAVSLARTGRGAWALVVSVIAGVALHRSGLVLVPGAVCALLFAPALRGPVRAGALALLLAALAVLTPALRAAFAVADATHLAPQGGGIGGALAAAFAPAHLAAAANVLLWLSPLLVLLPIAWRAGALASAERRTWLAFVFPALALVLFVHPRQGLPRDWDVFAPAAVVLAAATARQIAAALERTPRAGLAIALVLCASGAVGERIVLAHSTARTLAFVDAQMGRTGVRGTADEALLHQYESVVLARDGDTAGALRELGRMAALAPSPARLLLWYRYAVAQKQWRTAREAATKLVIADPNRDWPSVVRAFDRLIAQTDSSATR